MISSRKSSDPPQHCSGGVVCQTVVYLQRRKGTDDVEGRQTTEGAGIHGRDEGVVEELVVTVHLARSKYVRLGGRLANQARARPRSGSSPAPAPRAGP